MGALALAELADEDEAEARDLSRAAEAHRLRLTGESWEAIADHVGYLDGRIANTAVNAWLQRTAVMLSQAERQQALHLELARLDQLQAAFYAAAVSGDVAAANVVLKVIDRRMTIFGFGRPGKEPEAPRALVVIDGTHEEFIASCQQLITEAERPMPEK